LIVPQSSLTNLHNRFFLTTLATMGEGFKSPCRRQTDAFLDNLARQIHEKSKVPTRTFRRLIAILQSQQALPIPTIDRTAGGAALEAGLTRAATPSR
jgi:hypothetical protein